ncbi:histidine kinase dimerization/phosphoacceptor domain -containing protein [Chitinophaga pinensis]|uniref:Signal transduction histidine kinase n=1 Tax=Chitinophaga pinensis (strain ATCC 43595 / DSM 2588 / LMG 13176 / NBRC 15968 / NCIMB 11800 / UQM 2034) TaxID=485918 RepID=A0A979G6M1_CHIPD|nr:histidine kinase dimerization/phosphoacceptor domain -containing protein [Chitinophaga pinensis]ACU61690.1 signal transduction histidine kinase [Chitinophaga pinensis DSM 2588]
MRNALLVIFLILFTNSSLAQTSNLDELPLSELRQKLAKSANDTTKVQVQLALGHLMLQKPTQDEKDIDSAVSFATQAAALSRRLDYHFGIINAMLLSAETYYNRGDRETGLTTAQNALTFSQMHSNSDGEGRSYHLIAQYYSISDPVSLQNRILYMSKAISVFRKNGNILWLSFLLMANADLLFNADRITEGLRLLFEALNLGKGVSRRTVEGIYWNIGRISYDLGDYSNSLKYNMLAIETAKEVNDTTLQVSLINHLIASTYIKLEDYNKAIPYAVDALRLAKRYNDRSFMDAGSSILALAYTRTGELSKALALLEEMKNRAVTNPEKLSVTVELLNNLVYAERFGDAEKYVQDVTSLLKAISSENVTERMNAYNSLAAYYSEIGQVKQAYRYTELYATMAHKLNYAAGIRTAEYRYYKLVSLQGDTKSAMKHFLKEKEIKDSIDNIAKNYQISLLHIENETLEKNRHIDSLTREALISDIKLKRNQLLHKVTIGGIVLLLIIIALIYSRYRLKQRSNALLLLQKSEIDQQNISLQHLVSDKNQLIGEKDLLLKEVNHRVKNNLQIVMSLLDTQSEYVKNEKAQEAILESQNRVHAIALIHDQLYKTDNTTEINLSLYIKKLVHSLNSSLNHSMNKVAITCEIDEITLDVSQVVPVGIILNETVTNALKYAFPDHQRGHINVLVKHVGAFIEIKISDDGVGLPKDFNPTTSNTLGITLLEGLIKQLEGTFSIENNHGLTIFLKFPFKVYNKPTIVERERELPPVSKYVAN